VAGALLVVLVVAGAGWLATRRPVECELSLAFGARGADVRAVQLALRERGDEGRLVRTIALQLPSGTKAPITRSVRVRPGEYRVELVVTDAAGRQRTLRRTVTAERDACSLAVDAAD
jgi:hypothetical protein